MFLSSAIFSHDNTRCFDVGAIRMLAAELARLYPAASLMLAATHLGGSETCCMDMGHWFSRPGCGPRPECGPLRLLVWMRAADVGCHLACESLDVGGCLVGVWSVAFLVRDHNVSGCLAMDRRLDVGCCASWSWCGPIPACKSLARVTENVVGLTRGSFQLE